MGVHLTFVQPLFADILTEEVKALLQVKGPTTKTFIVQQPNYDLPVGDASNLHRTTVFLADEAPAKGMLATPGSHVVHISNLLNREEGQTEADVMTIVFESFPGTKQAKSVTRHYISEERLFGKFIKVTYRDNKEAAHDIWKFLVDGIAPAMS